MNWYFVHTKLAELFINSSWLKVNYDNDRVESVDSRICECLMTDPIWIKSTFCTVDRGIAVGQKWAN